MLRYSLNLAKSRFNNLLLNRGFVTQLSTNKNDVAASSKEWESARPFEEIPKPGLSFALKFLPGGELHNASFVQLHHFFRDNFGKIVIMKGLLGAPDFVLIYDPNDFAKVFRVEGIWPDRVPGFSVKYYREKLRPDVYNKGGLIIENGESWQNFRSTVNPVMMQPKVVSLYIPRIDEVTRDFLEITKKSRDAKHETPADFGNYIQRWALESIGTIALDTRFGLLESRPGDEADKLAKLMEEYLVLFYRFEMLPSLARYITTPKFAKFMKLLDEVTSITIKYVDDAKQRIKSEQNKKPEEEQGVLEKLLKVEESVATIMAMDMLAAGVDTTSAAVKALLYLLAINPEKQEKLRKEILSILPSKDTHLTAEKMKQIPYLRACMKEANRMLPVIAGTVRRIKQDLVLQGYRVPKESYVAMSVQLCLQSEEHYPKATQFIPERWLKDDSHIAEGCPHARDAHPFTYLPFGFGPRTCVGRRFAELEIAIFIIRFIREFNVEWHYPEPKHKSTFIEQLDGEMKFRVNDFSY